MWSELSFYGAKQKIEWTNFVDMTKSAAITPTTTAVVVRDGGDNEITTPTPSVPKNHRQHSASEPPSTQTPPQQHHRQHRADLQCLRALAIAAVMALHLAPRHFPNGYAGVDVFFVLSGYLMAKMLDDDEKREQKVDAKSIGLN